MFLHTIAILLFDWVLCNSILFYSILFYYIPPSIDMLVVSPPPHIGYPPRPAIQAYPSSHPAPTLSVSPHFSPSPYAPPLSTSPPSFMPPPAPAPDHTLRQSTYHASLLPPQAHTPSPHSHISLNRSDHPRFNAIRNLTLTRTG